MASFDASSGKAWASNATQRIARQQRHRRVEEPREIDAEKFRRRRKRDLSRDRHGKCPDRIPVVERDGRVISPWVTPASEDIEEVNEARHMRKCTKGPAKWHADSARTEALRLALCAM